MSTIVESAPVGSTPFWFGPTERPLFGWLHLPEDHQVRGGVVLCQPLGIEASCVYYSYRLLADQLAAQGVAVLRYDYDGTGDSFGNETDPDRVETWLSSVTVATEYLVGIGVDSVGLVGVRMGALFAAHEASRRSDVDVLVLWDPCLSGRAFLREQRFLRQMSGEGGPAGDDAVEAPGIRIERETVKTLSDLDLTRMPGDFAPRILTLVPPEVSRPKALERRLDGLNVEWQEATGQVALLDSAKQVPPYGTIDRITSWLSDAFTGQPVPVVPPRPTTAAVGRTSSGNEIIEHMVTLGDLRLFGIVTEGPDTGGRPTVVLVNEGGTHHIGQARIWVDLARWLAALDFRVLRFDLSGNGDSDPRPGQIPHVARAFEAIEDVRTAVGAIAPVDPSDVVLIGFCSGAYQVVEQALSDPPRGICIINPTFSFEPAEPVGSAFRPARQVPKHWFVAATTPALRLLGRRRNPDELKRWIKAVEVGTWTAALARRHPGIPEYVWFPINRFLFERQGVTTLERIVGSGVDTMLIVGPHDLLPLSLGATGQMQALRQDPRFRLLQLDELEHASWSLEQRRLMISVISEHLTATFGGPRSHRPPGRP